MKTTQILKSILIPTLGISAIGTIAAVSTSCGYDLSRVTSISLNKASLTLGISQTETLIATVLPENATDKTVTWTSSDTSVATVSNGTITAVGFGATTITVTTNDGRLTATCEVNVNGLSGYIGVTANADSTLTLDNSGGNNPNLQYSIDCTKWTTYSTTININQGQTLYLKGNNPTGWSHSSSIYSYLSITGDVSLSGNIMALFDNGATLGEIGDITAIPFDYCFYDLFRGSTGISSVDEDFLPAANLKISCYDGMFYQCTSLTNAPKLPSMNLTENCYRYMFHSCTSLATAPKLPATRLANSCYCQMFQDCSSLITAPELPATTLKDYCYYYMFGACKSLTTAPVLPAKSLTEGCYNNMFCECTSLTTAPELPATNLTKDCYAYMFRDCKSLTTAPYLPATTLVNYCYAWMFQACSALTTAPELPATTLAQDCYRGMFYGNKSLNSIKIGYTGDYSDTYFNNWVTSVASSGIFYYNGNQTAQKFQLPNDWTKQPF